ncbi:MAG: PKD domain-containing protein [Sphingomonadaceae bacterium]
MPTILRRTLSLAAALTVSACGGGSSTPAVNQAPLAQAGPAQTVLAGATVTLAGSGSDPEADVLTYAWSFTRPAGSAAALQNAHVATPTFVADIAGTYSATLVVNDKLHDSAPASVSITAQVPTAAFVSLWNGDACSDVRRIVVIDQHLVYLESHALRCSDSDSYRLFESTPAKLLCTAGGIVTPPTLCPGSDAATNTLMQTILANRNKADLGLGSGHTIEQVYKLGQ